MSITTQAAAAFVAQWQAWRHERLAAVSDPEGVASLVSTTWLTDSPVEVDGLPGVWRADGEAAVGDDLDGFTTQAGEAVGSTVRLDEHTVLRRGTRRVLIHLREGSPALRVFDAAAPGLLSVAGIDAFPPDEAWRVPARFEPGGPPRPVSLVDGFTRTEAPAGSFVVEWHGAEYRISVRQAGAAFAAVIADATSGQETYRFRFLRIEAPDEHGGGVVDFNRAFLPPCAFSDQYVCPLPPPGNTLDIAVRAGEKRVLRLSP